MIHLSEEKSVRSSALLVMGVVAVVSGCIHQGADQKSSGEFRLYISDQPTAIEKFDYLNVTFSKAVVFRNSSNSSTELVLERPTVDLTEVQGEKRKSVLNTSLAPGTYEKIELHVLDAEGEVSGRNVNIRVPSGKLMVTQSFTVSAGGSTGFFFDIEVVQRGPQGYNLLPVVSESGPIGETGEAPVNDPGGGPPNGTVPAR
ncbi:MAG: DUF4382 domain-containing protein [Candidatus Nanohaloarchaea archaeon]